MDLVAVIFTFICAYGLFMFVAYLLAKFLFPTIEVEEEEAKPKRVKTRQPRRYEDKRVQSRVVR